MIRSRPTSAWANRVRSKMTAKRQRERIVKCLVCYGPLTREAIGLTIGLRGDSLRPRVRELMRRRLIHVYDTNGKTRCGNKAERLAAARTK